MNVLIYETIQNIAKKKNIPIRKIETDLGFSNGTIRKWDTSQTISIKRVKAVANYLKVDPYTLLLVGIATFDNGINSRSNVIA